jgi:hypothetical protein
LNLIQVFSSARSSAVLFSVIGYLPTEEAFRREGHETNSDVTYWSKLAPGSLETVVEATRELIEELFDDAQGVVGDRSFGVEEGCRRQWPPGGGRLAAVYSSAVVNFRDRVS